VYGTTKAAVLMFAQRLLTALTASNDYGASTGLICVGYNRKGCGRYRSTVSDGDDRLIDELSGQGIAYVPFCPLGGFSPLQSSTRSAVASQLHTTPMSVAWPGCCDDHRTSGRA